MSRGINHQARSWKRALSMGLTFALILTMTLVTAVSANSGGITSSATCSAGEVHVFLSNNVSSDRKVTVTSTIPGFTNTGITDKSYNTTGAAGNTEIWTASGPQPFAGTVTLTIKYSNGSTEAFYTKTITAHDPCPAPGFDVDKGVSLSANGPFLGELTTTTGTTVHYRITIKNTGNVALTGVTLSDNTFNLVAKGCTIPTTLAVGARYDCDYPSTAVTGTTINVATGDTDQTGPDTGTAKVNAAPAPAPALTVDKGVSLSDEGPFTASLTTTLGTTIHYRITITNTGNVTLHGVTLTDNTFDLVAKGCDVPTTLAVGAHFTCNYTSSAVVGTTENTAKGDSEETGPESDTATVTVTAAPALAVTKGVSLTADGPFEASLTTTTGTMVHYRITVTNTGNVTLHGVTLTDNTFDLVAKGCTIPTTLAVGAHFDCDYTAVAATGTTTNVATGDSEETDSDTGTATVTANPVPAPDLRVRKAVGLSADGPFVNILTVEPGTTVHYRITVTNTGNVALTGVTLSDNTFNLVAKGCTIPTTLAVGASFDCDYPSVSTETGTINTATADSNETGPETDTATVNPAAQQAVPVLTVQKTNNAPIVHIALPEGGTADLPTAAEGSTVTFTLSYTLADGPVSAGTINDVLPVGLTYVAGSATTNGEFALVSFNPATRTLTWTAASVSAGGTVTYKAKVNVGANGLEQPLENVATIASEETQPDSDTSDVFVPVPPKAETHVPTAPPTDTVEPSNGPSGSSLPLALAVLGVILLAIGVVTPVPATVRRRNRR